MQISEEYKIIETLGSQKRRKFGTTYLTEHRETKKKAVLKHIIKDGNKQHIHERLIAEASFYFDEIELPKVLKLEEHSDEIFLLLDYKPGKTVDRYWESLKRRERFSFVCQFMEKLQLIFETLERRNIVHCDIKPSNILIAQKENSFDVYLIDFGLSISTNQTEERKLLFPLGYAAPELLLNHLDCVNQRTDQFSLGVLIWRLYVGRLPLTHPNPSIFTNLQLTHPLPEHSSVPKKVFMILKKMTYKHQFEIPPNKMNKRDVKDKLAGAMTKRYHSFEEITLAFQSIKPPFYQIRSRR